MKRLLMTILILALAFNFGMAKKGGGDKAGKIDDNGVFTDSKYGYSLTIPEEWNASVKKDKGIIRLIMSKKQYNIPLDFQSSPNHTKIPQITVIADVTPMNLDYFVDSLLSDKYKSKQKKQILQECEILFGDYRPKGKGKMSVGDVNGILTTGEKPYTKQIAEAGGINAQVISNLYGGSIFFTKNGDNILIFHFICENLYYDDLHKEFMNIMNTLQLDKDKK